LLEQFQDLAEILFARDHGRVDNRLLDLVDLCLRRPARRVVDFDQLAIEFLDAIADAGRGCDEVDVELALQAFLDDLEVQKPEEAAAETETERGGVFRLKVECAVVET